MIFTYSQVLKTAWKQSKRIVPITGRFSERKRHEERPDSSTCEPISVGSMDSTNRLSRTGSTIVHNSLSTEEQFKFPPEKPPGKEILEHKIDNSSMDVDISRTYPYKELETKEQVELVNNTQEFNGPYRQQVDNASMSTKNDNLTSENSTNFEALTAQYSSNFVESTKEVDMLEGNDSHMTFNLDTNTQLIANQNIIENSGGPFTQQNHVEDKTDANSDDNTVGIPRNGGVQSKSIVHNSANYSQMKSSSKQCKVKVDAVSNNNNNQQHSDSWSQNSQALSDDVFLPLQNKPSRHEEKLQSDETNKAKIENEQTRRNEIKNNVKIFPDNKLPPLHTVIAKGSRNELPSATPQLKIDVVVSSDSPSHSPEPLPKRRRVTVATCHPNLQKVAETDASIQNGYAKQLLSGNKKVDTIASNVTNSTPCLQNSNQSMTSLRVDKRAKRKLSGFKRPNIPQAFRKKNMNPNGLLRMKQEHKAVRTLLIVVGTFVICWLPHFIGIFCILSKECTWPDRYFAITTWLAMLNSGCNPIIYGAMSRQFRKRFRQILQCKRGFF